MIKRRTVLAGMATAGAAAGLTACGKGGGGKESPSGKVELTYMHRLPDAEGMTKVDEIVARWNKENPNIQVKAVKFDGKAAEMVVRLENEVKAGTAPDLAQVGYAEVPGLFTKGLLQDVTAEAKKYEKNFAAPAFKLMAVGGATVGLPQDTGPLVYYYNEEEFTKLGLKAPTTTAELTEAAMKAKSAGKYVVAFESDEALNGLSGMAAAAGAVWYKTANDSWSVEVTSPETAKVAEFWQKLLDDKAVLAEQRWGKGFTKALVDGKLIGTIGAAWEASLLAGDMKDAPGAGKWKVAQLPAFGDKPMSGPDGGSGVAVLKGSKHPAEAMQFNDWFNTQVKELATQGLVVAATAKAETPEALQAFFSKQDVMAELAKANEAMSPEFVFMPTWATLNDPMVRAAESAAKGDADTAAIFEAAHKTSVSSLKNAGLPVKE